MAPVAVDNEIDTMSAPPLPKGKSGKKVESFDASSAPTIEQMKGSLTRNGAFYLRNFMKPEDMATVVEDVKPYLGDDRAWEGQCFPPQTRRICGIVAKSDTFREKAVMNKQWLDLCNDVLSITTPAWFGEYCAESTSKPVLGGTLCFQVSPGSDHQGLHRDSMPHHVNNPKCTVDEYSFDRDVAIHMFIAGTKTTKENGATRFVPGSHLDKNTDAPNEDDAVYAEMEPGDAMIMLSSIYHGGSGNMSKDENENRLVFTVFMSRGTMRAFENQYLTIPPEQAAKWSDEELEVCGYALSRPFLGIVNFLDPFLVIRGQMDGPRHDITQDKKVNANI